jgi:outer membrane immunogenic protein
MKSLIIAASSASLLLCAAPALAQSINFNPTYYGTLGYNDFNGAGADLPAISGRLGAKLLPYVGVEGEVSVGVGNDRTDPFRGNIGEHLNDQYAGYVVGYAPLTPKFDLLARVGYGHSDLHATDPAGSGNFGADSWNYGAGGQYFFDHVNGVRADYTREDFQCAACGSANVWSLAYVRKF